MRIYIDSDKQKEIEEQAEKNSTFCDDQKEAGPIPEVKQTFNCKAHGEQVKTYIPIYEHRTDGIKGLPCKSHTIRTICKICVEQEISRLSDDFRQQRKMELDQEKEGRLIEKIKSFGVSDRNINYQLENITPVNNKQAETLDFCRRSYDAITNGKVSKNLVLSGSVGTGKTLICSAMVHSLIRSGRSAGITTVSHMIRRIKSTWSSDAEEREQDVIDCYVNVDLLIIDEIGVQFNKDTEKMFLFEIIDGRYNKMRPTFLVSNLDKNGITENIGSRCMNRLKEDGGKVIAFDFESQRGVNRAKA